MLLSIISSNIKQISGARLIKTWTSNQFIKTFGISLPIIQAPMAGANGSAMVIAVSKAGGLGSLPCAMLTAQQIKEQVKKIKEETLNPINLNFFCHTNPLPDSVKESNWKKRLEKYYLEFGIASNQNFPPSSRAPFDGEACDVVLELNPKVVSFHFGLPEIRLLKKLLSSGIKVISSATSVDEARYLEDQGCDAIIAQGYEAGGHRGIFLSDDISTQAGTMALVPQIVDAVKIPVIASGGISDARGIVASFALGASAVQLGTAYLFCPEATISPVHRNMLKKVKDNQTVLTNIFTGKPARGIVNRLIEEVGPMSDSAPTFPLAGGAIAPLKSKTEPQGSGDFMSMWSGQSAHLCKELPAGELTKFLAEETLKRFSNL